MTKLELSPQATRDLESIVLYISLESPSAARAVKSAIYRSIRTLAVFPFLGPRIDYSRRKLRKKVASGAARSYLLYYQVSDDRIEIVRILHGARDQGDALQDSPAE